MGDCKLEHSWIEIDTTWDNDEGLISHQVCEDCNNERSKILGKEVS